MTDKPLSPKELFCLRYLAKQDATTWDVCQYAMPSGGSLFYKCDHYDGTADALRSGVWAHSPFRSLEKRGLIKKTGKLASGKNYLRAFYTITDAGREALRKIDEEGQ